MIIALQYYAGDEELALSLARLIADIEPKRRDGDLLVLARRRDCPLSAEANRTEEHCSTKFPVMMLQSERQEVGHPDGCFGLWYGTLDKLHRMWIGGAIQWDLGRDVFTCEADGAPIRRDWISRLETMHRKSLATGKRITGAAMDYPVPHVNGNMVLDLSIVADYPGLAECPSGVPWDCHHGTVLLRETRPCLAIRNDYDSRDLTAGYLKAVAYETAWVHGCKDESLMTYARKLVQ